MKIKTRFTILISGDCCLVDNFLIKRLYNQIIKKKADFIKSEKKLIHEGVNLFRTKIWKKVYEMTKKDYQKEHPGFVVKEYPKLFKICNFAPLNYEIGKKFRLSVDTQSDLDFFNVVFNIYFYLTTLIMNSLKLGLNYTSKLHNCLHNYSRTYRGLQYIWICK